MEQFNFETNIKKRMPDTGKVFMVDRMTSDYAMAHPFDVDGFIEQVYEHWNGTESRETIRQYFNYGLGCKGEKFSTHCPAKHRDKVVKDSKTGIGQIEFGKWPEHVGGLRQSLIEAWNKGAEYHTKGFRQGDVLPDILPSCKITRLDNGEWIALFPKDKFLLESHTDSTDNTDKVATDTDNANDNTTTPSPEPIELDLFACNMTQTEPLTAANQEQPQRAQSLVESRRTRRQRKPRQQPRMPRYEGRAESVALVLDCPTPMIDMQAILKFLGVLAAVCVVLFILYNTGLLIPLGLIGLGIGGLLK